MSINLLDINQWMIIILPQTILLGKFKMKAIENTIDACYKFYGKGN